MTATDTQFAQHLSTQRKSAEEREAVLANPGFGNFFTDHTAVVDFSVDASGVGGWHDARLEPYGPIALDPAAAVLHYGQEIFEGMKAYRHADGSVWTFRADANAARLNRSAARLALPQLPEELFLESLRQLVSADSDWIPSGDGESLYLRPFMIATEAFLGVRPAREVSYRVIASPAGNYFGGEVKPVDIWVSRNYARAGRGGTGAAKAGGNYASSLAAQLEAEAHGCKQVLFLDQFNDNAVEELGGMNVFFVFRDGSLVTPALSGTILEGVTRSSIMTLLTEAGHTVTETRIALADLTAGLQDGTVTEVFACGTAAVVTPIGRLASQDFDLTVGGGETGAVTASVRRRLTDIQWGRAEDTHGWLHRLV
jgi:branched-chain amino acid aminotransferase